MINFKAIRTCAATGSNFASQLPRVEGLVEIPLLSTADVQLHLGGNASWEQRRAFEWGMLTSVFAANGDEATSSYCLSRVAAIAQECGY